MDLVPQQGRQGLLVFPIPVQVQPVRAIENQRLELTGSSHHPARTKYPGPFRQFRQPFRRPGRRSLRKQRLQVPPGTRGEVEAGVAFGPPKAGQRPGEGQRTARRDRQLEQEMRELPIQIVEPVLKVGLRKRLGEGGVHLAASLTPGSSNSPRSRIRSAAGRSEKIPCPGRAGSRPRRNRYRTPPKSRSYR